VRPAKRPLPVGDGGDDSVVRMLYDKITELRAQGDRWTDIVEILRRSRIRRRNGTEWDAKDLRTSYNRERRRREGKSVGGRAGDAPMLAGKGDDAENRAAEGRAPEERGPVPERDDAERRAGVAGAGTEKKSEPKKKEPDDFITQYRRTGQVARPGDKLSEILKPRPFGVPAAPGEEEDEKAVPKTDGEVGRLRGKTIMDLYRENPGQPVRPWAGTIDMDPMLGPVRRK
jgi:hypothetical protein